MSRATVSEYMTAWLKAATKGNVIHFADSAYCFDDRLKLYCRVCKQQLDAPRPENSFTIDYGIQQFVKLHAHVGGHEDKPVPRPRVLLAPKELTGRKFR